MSLHPEQSLQLARRASRFFENKYPQATIVRGRVRAILAEALLQTGALDEAERMFTAALEDGHALNGDAPHPQRIRALDGLARCRLQRGDLDGARVRFAQALDTARATDDRSGRLMLRARIHLLWAEALLYRDPHRVEQLAALRQPLAQALKRPDHPVLWQFDRLHGELATELGTLPPAASRLRAVAAGLQRQAGTAATPQPVGLLGVD
jgi:tetratricopeptide (TPR) repeat protein